jgi:uncharacterized cupin superfamily protein
MTRQNLFADGPWVDAEKVESVRYRTFWRPHGARMGATLYEFAPGSPGHRQHIHYGAEEMFFVLSGPPVFRRGEYEEQLEPGDFVFCPEGRRGLHSFANPTDEPVRLLAMSAGSFPDVVAYPEEGYAWVATHDPDLADELDGDAIIARFDPPEDWRPIA